MLFMNEYEIDEAVERHAPGTVAGTAARFLAAYRDEVNQCSDGWTYWRQPVNAAAKLMQLVQQHRGRFGVPESDATPAEFTKGPGPNQIIHDPPRLQGRHEDARPARLKPQPKQRRART